MLWVSGAEGGDGCSAKRLRISPSGTCDPKGEVRKINAYCHDVLSIKKVPITFQEMFSPFSISCIKIDISCFFPHSPDEGVLD